MRPEDAIGRLPEYDVSSRRAADLRRRCHAALNAPPPRPSLFTRVVYPALLGTWGATYLFATLWRFAQALRL